MEEEEEEEEPNEPEIGEDEPKWKRELAATRAGLRRIDDDKDKPVLQRSVGEDETDKAVTRSEAAMLENNDDSSSRKKAAKAAIQPTGQMRCLVCDKTVYHMEKIEVDGKCFHKKCFRCKECNKTLR
jgi:hypothetical protein